jgi:AbrB family looped-hinge helix DNA binding protein
VLGCISYVKREVLAYLQEDRAVPASPKDAAKRSGRLMREIVLPRWEAMSTTTVVEEKGRVVIQASVRRQLGIKPGTELEIDVREGGILMRPKRNVSAKRTSSL